MPHAGSKLGLATGGPQQGQGQAASSLKAIAGHLFRDTGPLRNDVLSQLQALVSGGTSPSLSAAYMPARESLEGQFQNVHNQLLGSLPRGGQLNQALIQNDIARAGSIGNLDANLRQNAFGQGLQTAFQAPGLAIAGNAAAGNQYASMGQLQQLQGMTGLDQLSQLMQGLGMAHAGKGGGGKTGAGLGVAPLVGGGAAFL